MSKASVWSLVMSVAFWSMLNSRLLAGMRSALVSRAGRNAPVALDAEALGDLCAVELLTLDVAEEVGEHLEQVRLTGAEEARDPDTVGVGVVGVRLQAEARGPWRPRW
ncbi:MAG: hypothetical protein V9G13_14670 [Marmoricola sp.]